MSDTDQTVTYNFDDFANIFVELGAFGTPSELHGLMCGQLAAGVRCDAEAWLAMVVAHLDVHDIDDDDDKAELVNLYDQALSQLSDGNFGLQLLLPDDDHELAARVDALGSWCSGFLGGFGLAFDRTTQKLTQEMSETMEDISQIAQVGFNESEDLEHDSDEQSYMELTEFVRMAVSLVFGEYNTSHGQTNGKQPLH